MAPPSPASRASARPLPLDALYEVLLRVPAKDLCRFRAVCWPWRSLLSDPRFVAAHAARHPGPLIVAARDTDRSAAGPNVDIRDLSGRVIKRVVAPGSFWEVGNRVTTAQVDGDCLLLGNKMSCLLLNPSTGAVSELPQGFAKGHSVREWQSSKCRHLLAFGKVASTGEYKVLRLLHAYYHFGHQCEVITLDGSSHAWWRGKNASPGVVRFNHWSRVTIDGIVYFLLYEDVMVREENTMPVRLASFDLETEEWRAILRGPLNLMTTRTTDISVASLNGCLVVVHYAQCSFMNLWFLMDFEEGLWAKQHSILLNSGLPVQPLFVLNDGKIVTYCELKRLLRIYDPKTCTYIDVAEVGRYEIGLHTRNLLSLPDGTGAQLVS
ncbi:F-box/LRR-repeat protein At2g43260-like [Panicum virgatum]|uniref:F-box domain-containing protein n=1 Tax=Panicum virgatum TaxID=38727 RepID=A0A8T0VFH1_PANVG|nr:F-box/LRR-repeat protein At2g43260-like [Panicum virgatum]KAG2632316.1 hypothetical protein PVAP13_2NG074100 [Panicum virgatum]